MVKFDYSAFGGGRMPMLPLVLERDGFALEVLGLLDTGASVNVLPHRIGLQLGAVWERQTASLRLSGNLANYEAKGLLVSAKIANFELARLAFAWTKTDEVPLILGQTNFFLEFDICFYGSQKMFEINKKSV